MEARLTSAMLASSLIRRVQTEGGMAAVLAKGDETSGTVLVVSAEKGRNTGLWERLMGRDGHYGWTRIGPQDVENHEDFDHYIERRRRNDPDLWLIELDIANAERFIVDSSPEA